MEELVGQVAADCWRWLKATWAPFVAFAISLVLVTFASYQANRAAAAAAAVLLLVTALLLGHVTREARASQAYAVGRARAVVAGIELFVGLELMAWTWAGGPDAAGFLGLGIALVSAGALVSELRRTRWMEGRRGPVLLGAAVALAAGGIVLAPSNLVVRLLLGAVVVAMLGTELASEDHLRRPHRWPRIPLAALGAALLVGSIGSLVVVGMGWGAGVVTMLVILAVVWMVSADSESLLVVLVLAGALLWAAAPRPASSHPDRTPVASEPYFLVLGDSYISGEGAKQYEPGTNTTRGNGSFTNGCRRAPTAWPNLLASSGTSGVPSRVLFLPCSGAETRNVRLTPPVDDHGRQNGPAELVELAARRQAEGLGPPAFVMVSLGGNDAGFGTIGRTCVGPGDCSEVGDQFLAALQHVEANLDASYADIRSAVGPGVPVVVTGYPIPLLADGPCKNVLLTANERHFVVAYVKELNRVVQSAATRAGFSYLDTMEDALVNGHDQLCGNTNPVGMNFIGFNPQGGSVFDSINPQNWIHNSLHPNEAGHRAMLAAAEQWFSAHTPLAPSVAVAAAPRAVPAMGDLFPFGFTRLCTQSPDSGSCDLAAGGWADEQIQHQVQAAFLPFVVALVGAWMIAIGPIGWATERSLDFASLVIPSWRRQRLARGGAPDR